ncbi:MAG: LamG-like jellyroll fold domain-containing protein [Bacteroidota bacterium]|jgi:hypothetical protein
MKLKSILLTAVAMLGLTAATMAQVPNYVPTNGLVGWWPFNGNANDESGNGNNGTVNGATPTTDRNGNVAQAYSFNGSSNISVPHSNNLLVGNAMTMSMWFKQNTMGNTINYILQKGTGGGCTTTGYYVGIDYNFGIVPNGAKGLNYGINSVCAGISTDTLINNVIWHSMIIVYAPPTGNKIYIDGVLTNPNFSACNTCTISNSNNPLIIGAFNGAGNIANPQNWNGLIDDIGIWNRALTQQEIIDLFNSVNCANNTAITPQTNSLATGSTATFTASTSDPNPSYFWQSDFGQGYVTLNNYGSYSGANTATLNIANIQLSEHNQPIRVISTSGNCIDTSNVAVINILDTCLVTVYDTLLTTVTDTLIINTQITGINPPNNLNTLKVYPNPASTHITIDYGNFNAMSGYTLTIENSIGQTVFTTPINQQTSYIDLSTWSGNGIYFVQLIDPQNNTIENRKIVIQ